MALREYLISEVGQDRADGLFTRREALRRLGLLGLGATAAAAVLASCGDDDDDASGADATSATTTAAASATTAATAAPATTAAAAAPTTDGAAPSTAPASSTASPTASPSAASAAPAGDVTFDGPAGLLHAHVAPAAAPKGAVLVIHENRGLTDHFRDLSRRFAAEGYTALALDLASRAGGSAAIGDEGQVGGALGALAAEDLVADMRAGLDELEARAPGAKLAIVGFCFGGGQVWSLLDATEPRLAAAVPFYGPGPSDPDFSGDEAAVLAIYAELDSRVNASRDAMAGALTAAGLVHEVKTYPGVDHAFFNDTGARYDATQADAAFQDVLAWFGTHLA
jgi:carboxymethylenebutenolidase